MLQPKAEAVFGLRILDCGLIGPDALSVNESAKCDCRRTLPGMTEAELKARTKAFALRVMKLVDALPKNRAADVVGRQVLRSATSVGANYRSACRARSQADFVNKLAIVEEEADETAYWLELLADAGLIKPGRLADLMGECNEITAIVVASIRTSRRSTSRRGTVRT
jgi:four helix bundle protein